MHACRSTQFTCFTSSKVQMLTQMTRLASGTPYRLHDATLENHPTNLLQESIDNCPLFPKGIWIKNDCPLFIRGIWIKNDCPLCSSDIPLPAPFSMRDAVGGCLGNHTNPLLISLILGVQVCACTAVCAFVRERERE